MRVELMQVFGILMHLHEVLLYSDDDDATSHADVAKVSGMLVNECVRRLESIVKRYKAGEFCSEGLAAEAERCSAVVGRPNKTAEGE